MRNNINSAVEVDTGHVVIETVKEAQEDACPAG